MSEKYTHRIMIQGNVLLGRKEDLLVDKTGRGLQGRFELSDAAGSQFGTLNVQSSGAYRLLLDKPSGIFTIELSRQDVEISELGK